MILPTVQILIHPNGQVEQLVISLLEDLLHDLEYFKQCAQTFDPNDKPIQHKRFLRAALLNLIAYSDGVIARCYYVLLRKDGITIEEAKKKTRNTHFQEKCTYLEAKSGLQHNGSKNKSVKIARELRNEYMHLKITDEIELFNTLSLPLLESAQKQLFLWLDEISKQLRLPRHPETADIALSLLLPGEILKEDDSASGALP